MPRQVILDEAPPFDTAATSDALTTMNMNLYLKANIGMVRSGILVVGIHSNFMPLPVS